MTSKTPTWMTPIAPNDREERKSPSAIEVSVAECYDLNLLIRAHQLVSLLTVSGAGSLELLKGEARSIMDTVSQRYESKNLTNH